MSGRKMNRLCLSLGVLLVVVPRLHAVSGEFAYSACTNTFAKLPELILPKPVVIGCDLPGCWPGDPAVGELTWDIRFTGSAFDELILESTLPKDLELGFTGSTSSSEAGFVVKPGRGTIEGLPLSLEGNALVLTPKFKPDGEAVLASEEGFEGFITIDQTLAGIVVSSWRWKYLIEPCPWLQAAPSQDRIKVSNPLNNDDPVVLVDLPSVTCRDDELFDGYEASPDGDSVFIGDAQPHPGSTECNSEVAVFAKNRRLSYEQNVDPPWTAAADVHHVTLHDRYQVTVSIWLVRAGADSCSTNNQYPSCWQDGLVYANTKYNENRVGVQFMASVQDLTGVNGNSVASVANTIGNDCSTVEAIQSSQWYKPGRLNVYYVEAQLPSDTADHPSVQCGDAPRAGSNIIFVTTTADQATLAHEIGHAYGLRPAAPGGHVNYYADSGGFGSGSNIMWGFGGSGRDHLTIGQVFRMNVHPASMLNVNCDSQWSTAAGDCERREPTRYCETTQVDVTCPVQWRDLP